MCPPNLQIAPRVATKHNSKREQKYKQTLTVFAVFRQILDVQLLAAILQFKKLAVDDIEVLVGEEKQFLQKRQ